MIRGYDEGSLRHQFAMRFEPGGDLHYLKHIRDRHKSPSRLANNGTHLNRRSLLDSIPILNLMSPVIRLVGRLLPSTSR